jgi:two-component system, LytTR family, response regulator LytT
MSNLINVLIVEDELIIAEDLKIMLQNMDYEVIGIATSFLQAEKLLETTEPDIILIDIILKGEKTGVDLAMLIRENYQIPFIYVTSSTDKITLEKAKKTLPNGYLLKPFQREDIYVAVEIALANFAQQEKPDEVIIQNSILIKDGTTYVKLKFSDIQWLQAEGNYVEIHTTQKKHLIRTTLKDFFEKIPKSIFLQIHKSYVVNLKSITSVDNNFVHIAQNALPLSRVFRKPFIDQFSN